ncbi:MAG: universal stress protein [Bryobacteraceae bacterium]|jgi:two-component system sensor histidine kinase KdpD
MTREPWRKTPEEYLREAQAEEAAASRKGYLKLFLGYASGVGKSFRMLDEARRRSERGQDVVVGAVQPRVPLEVEELLRHLEVVPLKTIGEGTEIDVEALIRRHPAVCFIDGLAYDNPPGARNPTRWQDAQELMDSSIKVIGSINIQYIAELQEQVEAITGKHVSQTVPIAFVKSADEIEIVDASAEEPDGRSPQQRATAEQREQRLSKLRELALVLAAEVVDQQLGDYLERHHITQQFSTHERILVCVTPRSNAREMIETARTIADRFHAEMVAAYVNQPGISPRDQAALDEKLAMARQAGARIEILESEEPVDAILDFARSQRITQLFIGHSQHLGFWSRLWGNPVEKLIYRSQGMDVRVFPQ